MTAIALLMFSNSALHAKNFEEKAEATIKLWTHGFGVQIEDTYQQRFKACFREESLKYPSGSRGVKLPAPWIEEIVLYCGRTSGLFDAATCGDLDTYAKEISKRKDARIHNLITKNIGLKAYDATTIVGQRLIGNIQSCRDNPNDRRRMLARPKKLREQVTTWCHISPLFFVFDLDKTTTFSSELESAIELEANGCLN